MNVMKCKLHVDNVAIKAYNDVDDYRNTSYIMLKSKNVN